MDLVGELQHRDLTLRPQQLGGLEAGAGAWRQDCEDVGPPLFDERERHVVGVGYRGGLSEATYVETSPFGAPTARTTRPPTSID